MVARPTVLFTKGPLLRAFCACVCLATLLGGCTGMVSQQAYDDVAARLEACRDENRKLTESRDTLQTLSQAQQKQIDSLLALGDKRLQSLYYVDRIALGAYTGGVDLDGQAGDEGVKVYLQPIDQHGSVLKAPANVTVQVYDLARGADYLVLQCRWSVEETARQWHSGFMAYHYSFECPWQGAAPGNDELTIRVEFVEYLTGKRFTAQKVVKVNLSKPAQ